MTSKQASPNQTPQGALELVSMYLSIDRAHGFSVSLGPENGGVRQGTVTVDPNNCGLDVWGDRTVCTRIGSLPIPVTVTRTDTTDPKGRGRVLHVVESPQFPRQVAHLVHEPATGLWYGVFGQQMGSSWVVPLFPSSQT